MLAYIILTWFSKFCSYWYWFKRYSNFFVAIFFP